MIPESGEFPEVTRAVAALMSICPEHTAAIDLDCGACGARQDAACVYLLTQIDDVAKALKL